MTVDQFVDKIIIITHQSSYSKPAIKELVEIGIEEMKTAGVLESVIFSSKAIGFLASFCVDMDTPNSGAIKMSDYTKKKLTQLATIKKEVVENV